LTTEEGKIILPENETHAANWWISYGGNVLWIPVFALTGFGILFVYSASSVYALQFYHDEFYFVKRQAFFLIPSFFVAFVGARLPFHFLFKYINVAFIISLLMTFATHLPHIGRKVSGAARWLNLGFFSIQPADFLKVFGILFLVSFLSKNKGNYFSSDWYKSWKIWLYLIGLILVPFAVILQKDLGTTIVILSGYLSVLFMNGLPKRYIAGIFGGLSLGFILAVLAEPYRIARVMAFLNPFKDPLGAGFQVIQSFVAVANGGLFGKGIGESQQKLFFLPEAHTDFILAVITEEMGFMGVLVLAILYGVLYYAILRLILYGKSTQERLLASGCFAMLALTTIVNMGVVAGALPTKGLPLPFISNGGSALIANYFIIGLMAQISRRIHQEANV
jgi:cell division protein FtsW